MCVWVFRLFCRHTIRKNKVISSVLIVQLNVNSPVYSPVILQTFCRHTIRKNNVISSVFIVQLIVYLFHSAVTNSFGSELITKKKEHLCSILHLFYNTHHILSLYKPASQQIIDFSHTISVPSYLSVCLSIQILAKYLEHWVFHNCWKYLSWNMYTKMLLLLLSHFSRVRLCATPWTAAHQAPPSLGFSRQEHWRGLPFPSPMHESEKWKWSRSVVSDS